MKTIVALAALALLPLAPLAPAASFDPDEFGYCVLTTSGWRACASRDHTWYCYSVWTGMPPAVEDCFQFIGP